MARGIMADKKEKIASPTSEPSGEVKDQNPVAEQLNATTSATCSCTKISTMQLFYEMKQKFPTVPDHVVCEFVGQNCHNRSACIDCLEDYPNSANVYPQALRQQSTKKRSQCQQSKVTSTNQNVAKDTKNVANSKENSESIKLPAETLPPLPPPTTIHLTNLNCCTRPINRPTRQAPPPPITPSSSPTSKPNSLPNQPLNLSVNVIVSPSSSSRPPKSQQSQSHYSFTLHQPNTTHVTNDQMLNATGDDKSADVPSLKYTSSAYDAEIGYQSRFEITVAGTNPKTSNDNCDQSNDNRTDANSISLTRSCQENSLPSVAASSEFLEETETVHHQILCKQKLVLELEKDRKRLERMQRELQAIQEPMPDGGLEQVNQEIEQIRNDCKLMAAQVEEAGPSYALGETNEAFYRNLYTGQQLPMRYEMRPSPLRPHRPAPVPDINQPNCSTTDPTGTDPRFISTTSIPQPSLNPPFNETNQDGWVCDLCTFQNKYTQRTCEACRMPFLSAGNQMGYNNGMFVPQPLSSQPAPLPSTQPPYPLYMPMPMPMHSMPYTIHNTNSMPYTVYYQTPPQTQMHPTQYYPTPSSIITHPQSMHSRF